MPPRKTPGSLPTSRASTPSTSPIPPRPTDRDRRLRGTWVGVITGKDAGIDGLPLAEGCTSLCHNDVTKIAPDKFTRGAERPRRDLHGQPQHQHALRGGLLPVPLVGYDRMSTTVASTTPPTTRTSGVRPDQQCSQQSHRQLVHGGERLPATARLANASARIATVRARNSPRTATNP